MCDHIITTNTFTTKAYRQVFKIQRRPHNCTSEKVIYFLRYKIRDDTPYVGKAETKFRPWFNNYKSKHRSFWKGKQNVPQKHYHSHYIQDCHRGIDDWEVILFEKCEIERLQEREMFWQHKSKTSLTMVPAGNKAKCLSSVNHTTKTIHHHHHHHHHHH